MKSIYWLVSATISNPPDAILSKPICMPLLVGTVGLPLVPVIDNVLTVPPVPVIVLYCLMLMIALHVH